MTNPTFPNQETIDGWIGRCAAPFLSRDKGVAFEAKRHVEIEAEGLANEANLLKAILAFADEHWPLVVAPCSVTGSHELACGKIPYWSGNNNKGYRMEYEMGHVRLNPA